MGNKVSPIGFRIGFSKGWGSCWCNNESYGELFLEDYKIKAIIKQQLAIFNITNIILERILDNVTAYIYCTDPGIIIGKEGERIMNLSVLLENKIKKKIQISVYKTNTKNLCASNIVFFIKDKLNERVQYRRVIKQSISIVMEARAEGIKILLSGRLGGAEIARTEKFAQGKVPTHTLRSDIDYCYGAAETIYGTIGIKVWIYKGEQYKQCQPLLIVYKNDPMTPQKEKITKGKSIKKDN